MLVAGEPVVVELLQVRAVDLEAAGEAADGVVALEDRAGDAPQTELVGRGKPGEAAADDGDRLVDAGQSHRRP